ncbi:non-canonical purine NTP phosphatase [Parashewanella spongiae]|uniref:Inosine/xanthosine triphosphatase n=1 Tax=Parashewanella spongiae TaxID=342950 RepID=A0A3A6U6A3_9GAMM|nr:inosine/xanthosine triphosphatase [Parashewanella spongiae]MCL1078859.1 inosine/xanthosine triphosphatase [Parashewanella spongiae]RJY11835.1 non-canonical purine NTP phosphatase [Parashewanella spongiae]
MSLNSIKVIVGSLNPVKVNATKAVFEAYFPNVLINTQGVDAPSNVADQPMTAQETRQGALNRVSHCQALYQADYFVAIEGGLDVTQDGPVTFAYIVICHQKQQIVTKSACLPLPNIVHRQLVAGQELGHVMDELFNTENIKQKGGAIGLLTNQLANRETNYIQAITLAMAPITHRALYEK